MRLVKKILSKVLQSHIVEVKLARHERVDVGGVELQVDLVVDGGLQVLVVVLVYLPNGHGCYDGWLRTHGFVALEQWLGAFGLSELQ